MVDYNDFYIEYPGHPRYTDSKLIEDDVLRVVIQKWEMIIFTNKGEVMGDYNFGGDLLHYLYQTKVAASQIKKVLTTQIINYIPEIINIGYKLEVVFVEDLTDFREVMLINFEINDYKVYAEIGKRYNK
jgi:hypothetical protein